MKNVNSYGDWCTDLCCYENKHKHVARVMEASQFGYTEAQKLPG